MQTILGLKVEKRLSSAALKKIYACYDDAIDSISHPAKSELNYIEDKIEKKHSGLMAASSVWVREMALIFYAMYEYIRCCQKGTDNVSPKSEIALIAAVFYYVNPFDVIPDHIPGTGFIDDFYVAKCCIKKLKVPERESLELYLNRLR